MLKSAPHHEQIPSMLLHSRTGDDAAQLETRLRLTPEDAEQWCQLGELCETLAREAADAKAAAAYRDKAVAALTQAIGLRPGFAKAHYALASVYRAHDLRLALLELEAAAKCDDRAYGDAYERARVEVAERTYSLGKLPLFVLESARENPRPEVIDAEFFFDDRVIRSAVVHTCASQGSRQEAKAWLFEAASPDPATDEPVAQVTISSTGNVFVATGRPAGYARLKAQVTPQREGHTLPLPTGAPPPDPSPRAIATRSGQGRIRSRRSGALVWLPLLMIIFVFSASFFAYLTLVAPPRDATAQRVFARAESPKVAAMPQATHEAPALIAAETAPPSAPAADALETAPAAHATAPPARAANTGKPASAASGQATLALTRREAQAIAGLSGTPIGTGATAATVEAPALPRDGTTAAWSPPNERSVSAASTLQHPPAAQVQKEESTRTPSEQKLLPGPLASVRKPESATRAHWQQRLQAELEICGRPGLWRNDLCRETTRWNYCHPDRWETVRECAVERFASSALN